MWQTSKASQWLEKYFGVRRHRPAQAAGALQVWLNEQLVRQRQGESLDVPAGGAPGQDELHITWPAPARGMA
jgi:hypothetical protein